MAADDAAPGATGSEPIAVRVIDDVETLKALADPIRLGILRVLLRDAYGPDGLRVMSVKELAAELGQPQTKLYRHMKQLEAVGLIQVAETRMVSGIQEQRYRAAQYSNTLAADLLGAAENQPVASDAVLATIDDFRAQLTADLAADRVRFVDTATADDEPRPAIIGNTSVRLPPATAVEFRDRLGALLAEIEEAGRGCVDGVEVELLFGLYTRRRPGA
jgi:DNA-binding transcriptional ArsR family regulator